MLSTCGIKSRHRVIFHMCQYISCVWLNRVSEALQRPSLLQRSERSSLISFLPGEVIRVSACACAGVCVPRTKPPCSMTTRAELRGARWCGLVISGARSMFLRVRLERREHRGAKCRGLPSFALAVTGADSNADDGERLLSSVSLPN